MIKNLQQYNSRKLLLEYRATIWRKLTFETLPVIDNKIIQSCVEQIRFTQELVNKLLSNKLLGDKMYWIIFASYMTDKQPCGVDEILSYIAKKYRIIPRRTYFRLKERAIKMMDSYLDEMALWQNIS